jgi:hypothetical protein
VSDGRAAWFAGWGTWIGSIAAIVVAVLAYLTYAHPHDPSFQSFSVTLNSPEERHAPGHGSDKSLNFTVKHCDVGGKDVSCVLTVVSPHYDHLFKLFPFESHLTDGEGDRFPGEGPFWVLTLERDQPSTFKIAFRVNKNIVPPATVQMVFNVDGFAHQKGFAVE